MTDDVTRIDGHLFISKANSKFFQKSLHCYEEPVRMQIPRVLCLRHAVVHFCLPRQLLSAIL